jgi:hypothetical protein
MLRRQAVRTPKNVRILSSTWALAGIPGPACAATVLSSNACTREAAFSNEWRRSGLLSSSGAIMFLVSS